MNRHTSNPRRFAVMVAVLCLAHAASLFAAAPEGGGSLTIVHRGGKEIGRSEVLPPRTWIGFSPMELTVELREYFGAPREAGVLVQSVKTDSPAAISGVRVGDVVISIDLTPIATPWDLGQLLRQRKAGQTVQVELVRNRVRAILPIRLDVLPIELRTIVYPIVPTGPVTPRPSHTTAAATPPDIELGTKLKQLEQQLQAIVKEVHKEAVPSPRP